VRAFHSQRFHEAADILGEEFRGIDSFRLVCLASPPWIDGDARKVFGVLGNLESIAGVIGGQVGDQD
jgi:hypothetical protein